MSKQYRYPKSFFDLQIKNAYYYERYDDLRKSIDKFAEELAELTFNEEQFRKYNIHLQLQFSELKMVYKRLLIFGECRIDFQ